MDSDMPDTKKQKTNPIKFKLMDSDQILEYDEQIARGSELISEGLATRSRSDVLPLDVEFEAFKKAMAYCEIHKGDTPTKGQDRESIGAHDRELLKDLTPDSLVELVNAAYKLRIDGLVGLGCQAIANLIEGSSVDEIRKMFNIKDDLPKDDLPKKKTKAKKRRGSP